MPSIRKAELCDTTGLTVDLVNTLAHIGVVYATECASGAGDVIASDWDTAEAVATIKGRGTVVGQIVEVG